MKFSKISIISVLIVVVGGSANAATLATSLFDAGDAVTCWIVNVGNKSKTVTIQLLDRNGNIFKTEEGDVPPNGHLQAVMALSDAGSVFCRFDLKGKTKDFRASACNSYNGIEGCVNIVPAQ